MCKFRRRFSLVETHRSLGRRSGIHCKPSTSAAAREYPIATPAPRGVRSPVFRGVQRPPDPEQDGINLWFAIRKKQDNSRNIGRTKKQMSSNAIYASPLVSAAGCEELSGGPATYSLDYVDTQVGTGDSRCSGPSAICPLWRLRRHLGRRHAPGCGPVRRRRCGRPMRSSRRRWRCCLRSQR